MARGDHLFVHCLGYSHHGIDCGDGNVIHFESDPWRKLAGSASSTHQPCIRETSVEHFSQGREVFVREYDLSDDPDKVYHRAKSRLGEPQLRPIRQQLRTLRRLVQNRPPSFQPGR